MINNCNLFLSCAILCVIENANDFEFSFRNWRYVDDQLNTTAFIRSSIFCESEAILCLRHGFSRHTGLDVLRYLPHSILIQIVFEIIEESDDALAFLEWICAAVNVRKWQIANISDGILWYSMSKIANHFLNRFMLTTILCCCHRFEKLMMPTLR